MKRSHLFAGIFAAVLAATALFAAHTEIQDTIQGLQVGTSTSQLLAFHGSTPVDQRSGSAQTALTDSTTGTAATTLAAGTGVTTITIPVTLANVANGDVLTAYTPGYKFKILSAAFAVTTAATTADKLTTLNIEIGTTNVTGGEIALTSANCTPLGAVVAGAAITAANTGSASATISIEASSTTAFAEGAGVILLKVQNMDTADTAASITTLANELRAALVEKGLIAGS